MYGIFSTSLFTRIFGDTTTEIIVNAVVISILAYILYKYVLRPTYSLLQDILALSRSCELVGIEITPPHKNQVDPEHTQNFMRVLQRIYAKERLSLEITSNKSKGVRYLIIAEKHSAKGIKKQISSYMPEVRISTTEVPQINTNSRVYTFKLRQHFAYPLKTYTDATKTDPIGFIASTFTRLGGKDNVSLQLVVRPFGSRGVGRLYNRLIKDGRTHVGGGIKYYLLAYAWMWLPGAIIGILAKNWALGLISALVIGAIGYFSNNEPPAPLTQAEEKLYEEIIQKLDQPLAKVDMRLSIDARGSQEIVDDFLGSLKVLDRPGFQSIVLASPFSSTGWQNYKNKLFNGRLSAIINKNSLILSATELGSLYHFPHGVMKVEGMARSHSKTLPAPISLRSNQDFDVIVGVNKHHEEETLIGLTAAERERHMYIVGGTGSGKTTMLKYQIVQDIRAGKGVAIIDPHGDLAEELLEYVPKERKKDLIYLNPDDLDHPIGVNLLELPEGLSGNDLLREKDRVTESVISVMRKVFSDDDTGGHRIEYILRNTIHTAFTTDNPTLFTIFRLLNDGKYAKKVIKDLKDEDLKAFWKNELGKAGSMQKVKMAAGITAKIGRFLFSASARTMLEKEKSDIGFSEVLDGKILVCNFSKGRLGEDTSSLFGTTILAKLQLAALKRSEQKQTTRKPFHLYVDEFQNFATVSFTQMLSEARKYKVYVTMAEQSTQQQDNQKLIDIILANVGTIVAFRTGSPKDEELLLPLFEPYIEKGEISSLPSYNFYCRISGTKMSEPTSGETLVL